MKHVPPIVKFARKPFLFSFPGWYRPRLPTS
jgi:hypothetical protein